jgi:hypothetical protein
MRAATIFLRPQGSHPMQGVDLASAKRFPLHRYYLFLARGPDTDLSPIVIHINP